VRREFFKVKTKVREISGVVSLADYRVAFSRNGTKAILDIAGEGSRKFS